MTGAAFSWGSGQRELLNRGMGAGRAWRGARLGPRPRPAIFGPARQALLSPKLGEPGHLAGTQTGCLTQTRRGRCAFRPCQSQGRAPHGRPAPRQAGPTPLGPVDTRQSCSRQTRQGPEGVQARLLGGVIQCLSPEFSGMPPIRGSSWGRCDRSASRWPPAGPLSRTARTAECQAHPSPAPTHGQAALPTASGSGASAHR